MAKKKSGGNNFQLTLLILAIVVIFILVAQLQEKDKKINLLTGRTPTAEKRGENTSKSGKPIADKEKIKKIAETNLEKLVGREKKSGENWFIDEIRFLNDDLVRISYEDGHTVNNITFKIVDQNDCGTWLKQ
ncbi:MAG: hypothetical protein WCI43_08710 [Candidatus Firestonebacteria bacterium]